MEKVPCIVVGAGAVGLSIAKAMSESGVFTLLLEKCSAIGVENSSHNSEVLHAGLYYPSLSLKAQFCKSGRDLLLSYLKRRKISVKQCGKLLLATSTKEISSLNNIYRTCIGNGLNELSLLTPTDVKAMEPAVSCASAMYSPFTSIFDSHSLMMNYLSDIEAAGSSLVLNCTVNSIGIINNANDGGCFQVRTSQGDILCDYVVNAAGLYSHVIASKIESYPIWAIPPSFYAKGNYYNLQGVAAKDVPFQRLIYPLPQSGGLGVHATLDLNGRVKFGPDVQWIKPTTTTAEETINRETTSVVANEYKFPLNISPYTDFSVDDDDARKDAFYQEIQKYWPAVQKQQLVPDYAGIRPKLVGPISSSNNNNNIPGSVVNHAVASTYASHVHMPATADFCIVDSTVHRMPGLVCLHGIESPGLTASLAIGEYVRDMLWKDKFKHLHHIK